jgi:adenosylmethionine-8-amino-7-oxononanoate aminotransferase
VSKHLFRRDAGHHYPEIVRGEGVYLYEADGRRILDGTAGAGNVTVGHGRQRIADAMAVQAGELAYCFSAFHTNPVAEELAGRIAARAPGDLRWVYLVSGGSEAIETALKIARQYHVLRGKPGKHKVISRWRSYHGGTLGALGVTGIPWLRQPFEPWLPAWEHIDPCYPYRCRLADCGDECSLACARQLDEVIRREGADNVAAFVAEPMVLAGVAAGVPPPEYLAEIRAICDAHDVLFIADEIITGFGRTGRWFAVEHSGVTPDLIAFGKGVSGGYCPMGGVVFRDAMGQAFAEAGEVFAHIFTYVNNPVAARVGLEVLDILESEDLVTASARLGDYALERARELLRHPSVGEVRGCGLLLGLELVADRDTRAPFPAEAGVSRRLGELLLERDVHLSCGTGSADYHRGDDVRFYPPLIITEPQIDAVVEALDEALTQLEKELGV